jgi:hypothetical protein
MQWQNIGVFGEARGRIVSLVGCPPCVRAVCLCLRQIGERELLKVLDAKSQKEKEKNESIRPTFHF